MADIGSYLAAVLQYYTSADRPYDEEDFPSFALGDLSVERVLAAGARTLLTGPAGSGKTTFLDWAALRAAGSRQALPIFASLRNYTSNLTDLLRVSVERFSPQADLSRVLSRSSVDPSPAFLLDAIDEVSPAFRPRVESDILELAGAWPTAPLVVTGRTQPIGPPWEKWSTVVIPQLTDQQVDSYLQTIPRGDILRRALLDNPQFMELARRPVFLHTIRNAWVHGTDFRTYLMREIPRYVAWRGHTKSQLPTSVSPQIVDELLSSVALDLAVRGVHSLNIDRLQQLASQLAPGAMPVSALAGAAQATDVLTTDRDHVSFTHLSLLESYAARALAARLNRPGVLEPLLVSVLAGPFGTAIANYFLSLISDGQMNDLRTRLSGDGLVSLVGKARDVLADRAALPLHASPDDPRRIGDVAAAVARYSDRQERARRDILVIAVHGFNTRGDWKNRLGLVLTRATDGERFLYRAWDYGEFRLGIFNPFARRRQVQKFQRFFNDLVGAFAEVPIIVVVAHSFGAYIVAHAARRFPEVEFNRALLLGAALPRAFDWSGCIARCGRVLNLVGGADAALAMARFIPGLGAAGRDGFLAMDERLIQVAEALSDHGDLFGSEYMRHVWLPFLRDGTTPHRHRGDKAA